MTTENIMRRLDDFELDLGLTYLEDQRLDGFRVLPLYREHYMLIARDVAAIGGRTEIHWREVAELPLCLLTPDMQNRRIINTAFRQQSVHPHVVVETDSIFALYSTFVARDCSASFRIVCWPCCTWTRAWRHSQSRQS